MVNRHPGGTVTDVDIAPALRLYRTGLVVLAGIPALAFIAPGRTWGIWAVLAATTLVSITAERTPDLKAGLLHDTAAISQGQRHRFVASGFIHGGYLHLAFNALAFASFSPILERELIARFGATGSLLFVAFYLASLSMIGRVQFAWELRTKPDRSLGASGGVFATVAASILLKPSLTVLMFFVIPVPGLVFLAAFTAISAWASVTPSPRLDAALTLGTARLNHRAHLLGLLAGLALGLVLTIAR